jgi:hypothetical protein
MISDVSSYSEAAQIAQGKLRHIRDNLFSQLYAEVPTEDIYWQHQVIEFCKPLASLTPILQKSITPGVQEYIEAVSYAHYLGTEKLITHEEMLKWLTKEGEKPVAYPKSKPRSSDLSFVSSLCLYHMGTSYWEFQT